MFPYVASYIFLCCVLYILMLHHNLQYDYKFIFSGGCTSVLPDGGSLSVGVPLFALSSAVLPNVSVFVFSVSVFVLSVPVFAFSAFFYCFQHLYCRFYCFPLPCSSVLKDPGMFLRFRQSA